MGTSGGTSGTPIVIVVGGSSTLVDNPLSTLLPLEQFREILGYHPYHFWGLSDAVKTPIESASNGVVFKEAWQDADQAGREDIIRAIQVAEDKLQDYLRFSVAPHYREVTLPWTKYHDRSVWRLASSPDAGGRRIATQLPEGFVKEVGIEQLTLLGTQNVVASDVDGDGLNDTFTITVNTSETDPSHIALYFAAADRLGDPVSDEYRIRPVKITFANGVATIVGRYWLLVKPVKYITYSPTPAALDPSDSTNFVTTAEVYTRLTYTEGETTDTSQSVLLWETEPCGNWGNCICGTCNGLTYTPTNSSQDPAAVGMTVARCGIRDGEIGLVIPGQALKDATSGLWYSINWSSYREPDRSIVRYLAGYPLDQNGFMDRKWRTTVARLAMAEMPRRLSASDVANRELYHWQFDLARAAGKNDEQYSISPRDLENPFGTLRGQVYAWKQVKNLRQLKGYSLAL